MIRVFLVADPEVLEMALAIPRHQVKSRYARVGCDKVFAVVSFKNVVHQPAGQPIARCEILEPRTVEYRQPVHGAQPEIAS